MAELVEGAAEVCREAGVALVGGETAELPGIYREGELDFAGTCVGVVDRDDLVDGSTVERRRRGDRLRLGGRARERLHARAPRARGRGLRRRPTCSRRRGSTSHETRALGGRAKALAHVTGGGIVGNLSRVVPDGLRVELDWDAWERPPVFALARAARRGGRAAARLQPRHRLVRGRRRAGAGRARDRADRVIGVLVSGNGTNLQALLDAGLPVVAVAVEPARRVRARARARGGRPDGDLQPRLPRRPRGARPRDGDLARGARRRAGRARRLHAPADEAVPRPLPGRGRQRPPLAAARVPRHARDRGRARRGRRDDRRHRPPRRRGRRHRPGHPPGGRAGRAARDARGAHPRRRAPAAARGRRRARLDEGRAR